MSEKNREIYWAIAGEYGLYLGTWFTRHDAIVAHSKALGKCWKQCYRKGDRAIKVKVVPLNRRPK